MRTLCSVAASRMVSRERSKRRFWFVQIKRSRARRLRRRTAKSGTGFLVGAGLLLMKPRQGRLLENR
jgi:hypothetical protein